MGAERKRLTIVHGILPKTDKTDFSMTSSERASQEEQNGSNFSSVAPSSEELWLEWHKFQLCSAFQ